MNKAKKIVVLVAATIALSGCIPWKTVTPYHNSIPGDREAAELRCSGVLEEDATGRFICNHGTGTRWATGIPGDYEHAVAECSGVVIEQGAYYACVKP